MDLPLATILFTAWSTFATTAIVMAALYWHGRTRRPATDRDGPLGRVSRYWHARTYRVTLSWRGRPRRVAPPVRLSPRRKRPDAAALEHAHRLWLDGLAGKSNGENLSDTGRHHLPPELLKMPTYRLGPDRVARAKLPDQN
ncbi:hypothetical protein [Couchioplanes caeruleus]|uniref:Uncharacterized protein n=1 Tax=Couchioplanes caeruleus subsp. caeruleus TaxID=56427 RepID=A0A1K0FHM0_9ACTN|nr:hypothetical protein [Couchioplanes caeruleus]OJF12232.1 hypothetical protein BG844_21820 [Couchioplanes caeruleus subsp. caeruleus]